MMPSSDSNNLPFFQRPDLSPFLVHLTKNSKAYDDFSAFDNLRSILMSGEIFGSDSAQGFIKGNLRATCFMDIPLSSLKYVITSKNSNKTHPRYEPYGVIVSKVYAYAHGCRPVLYLSNEEIKSLAIPSSELWRVVRLESVNGIGINWLHEREWRCKGAFRLPTKVRGVLVKSSSEVAKLNKEISNPTLEFLSVPSAILPLNLICEGLPYL